MRDEHPPQPVDLDERTQQAIDELQTTIVAQFPATTFVLERSPDDLDGIHLLAIADVDDPDEVGDLVVDRVVALHVDEGIPIHVIPLRTPARVRDAMAVPTVAHQRGGRAVRLWGSSV
jgi:hypothetical protein